MLKIWNAFHRNLKFWLLCILLRWAALVWNDGTCRCYLPIPGECKSPLGYKERCLRRFRVCGNPKEHLPIHP